MKKECMAVSGDEATEPYGKIVSMIKQPIDDQTDQDVLLPDRTRQKYRLSSRRSTSAKVVSCIVLSSTSGEAKLESSST